MFEHNEDTTEAVLNCNRVLVLIVCCVEDTVGQSWIHQQMVSYFYNNFTVMDAWNNVVVRPHPLFLQTLVARGSHFSSYSPRVSFSSEFSHT